MDSIFCPTDISAEIFSHVISSYAIFRCISKSTNKSKISWDGWDALIAQGYSVKITKEAISWELNGKLNDFLDLPSVEWLEGTKEWYRNGNPHRDDDLPAIEYPDGTKQWIKNGQLHRDNDLPAVESYDGTREWYRNGKRHRDNDLPAIEYSDGTKNWYRNGKRHRDNGLPAVEYPCGTKCVFYENGRFIKISHVEEDF